MATLRNKRNLAAINKENGEEHPRNNLAQNMNVPKKHTIMRIHDKLPFGQPLMYPTL